MSETDKIFNFIMGLKLWVKTKLYEQRVQSLSTTYVVAERLFDLDSDETSEMGQNRASTSGENEPPRPCKVYEKLGPTHMLHVFAFLTPIVG